MSNVWIYAVVSTDKQAETVDDQLAWANDTAKQNGWTVSRTFRGVSSGNTGTRKLLEQLLAELRSTPKGKRPSRILMTRLDRTGRGLGLEPMAAFAQIHQMGVVIHTREDGDNTIKRASDVLKPFLRILTGALENESRSDKWKAVHARRRAAGLHVGSIPFGVILVEGRAVPYEPEAAIVRELFEKAVLGWGYTKLARWAREVAPTKRTESGEIPVSWAPSSIKSIFESKTIRGLVVSEELWQAAYEARGEDFKARSPRRWPWPLAGAVRCSCGKMLSGHCAGSDPWRTRYYFCRYHDLTVGKKSHPSHRADKLEAGFIALLEQITVDPSIMAGGEKAADEYKAREKAILGDLQTLEQRRTKVWALAENDGLSGAQLRERLDEIDADRERARKELSRIRLSIEESEKADQSLASAADVIRELARLWPHAEVSHQQEVAKAVAACVGGLWALPERRNELLTGHELLVAGERIADAFREVATRAVLLQALVRQG